MPIQRGTVGNGSDFFIRVPSVYRSNSTYLSQIQVHSQTAIRNYAVQKIQERSHPLYVARKFQTANALEKSEKLEKYREYKEVVKELKSPFISTGLGFRVNAQAASFEAKASYYKAIAKYKNLPPLSVSGEFARSADRTASRIGATANKYADKDDIGARTAATTVNAAAASYASFRFAQKIAPTTIQVAKNLPNAMGKTANVIAVPIKKIVKSKIYIPSVAAAKVVDAAKKSVDIVQRGKEAAVKAAKLAKETAEQAKNATVKTIRILRGVRGMSSEQMLRASKKAIKAVKTYGLKASLTGVKKGINISGRLAATVTVKGITRMRRVTIPRTMKYGGIAGMSLATKLSSSDDMMVQGMGTAAQAAITGARAGKTAVKVTAKTAKTAVKGGIKTAKVAAKAQRYVKANGIKKSAMKALEKSGRSLVSLAIDVVKSLGSKVLVPLILIAVAFSVFTSLIGGAGGVVATMFGGVFSMFDEEADIEIEGYVADHISTEDGNGFRDTFVKGVVNEANDKMQKKDVNHMTISRDDGAGSLTGYRKLRKENGNVSVFDERLFTTAEVSELFYSEDEIVQLIEPFFQAKMFTEYEMSAHDTEALLEVSDLFDKLVKNQRYQPTTVHCGHSAACGAIHATDDCMNYEIEYHTDNQFHCASCDTVRYICNGHRHTHTETVKTCNRHSTTICPGHQVYGGVCYYHSSSGTTTHPPDKDECILYEGMIKGTYNGYESCVSKCKADGTHFTVTQIGHTDIDIDECWDYTISTSDVYDGTTYCSDLPMTTPCSNSSQKVSCSGHRVCKGHTKDKMEIGLGGVYHILQDDFVRAITQKRIDEFKYEDYYYNNMGQALAKENYEAVKEERVVLTDNYDILLDILAEANAEQGTCPLDYKDLLTVQWQSNRTGNDKIKQAALNALTNQVDSKTYWGKTDGGAQYDIYTDWNAAFVWYIMHHNGGTRYTNESGLTCKDTDILDIRSKLSASPYWQESSYTAPYRNAAAGDVIVMYYNIGIVYGKDNQNVYVLEGNNGDAVRLMRYPLDSDFIQGYYLMS